MKHEFAGAVVHDMRRAGAEPSCPGPPISCKDSIVQADEQFAIPSEGCIVCASQDEAHGVAVAADECCVLLSCLGGAVPSKNPVDLLDVTDTPSIEVEAATASASRSRRRRPAHARGVGPR